MWFLTAWIGFEADRSRAKLAVFSHLGQCNRRGPNSLEGLGSCDGLSPR